MLFRSTADHAGGTIRVTTEGIDSVDSHESLHIPWADTFGALWETPRLTVTTLRDGVTEHRAWLLAEPGQVPQAVRDRVSSNIVMDLKRTFEPGGVVRFVARRNGDEVVWDVLAEGSRKAQISAAATMDEVRTAMNLKRP